MWEIRKGILALSAFLAAVLLLYAFGLNLIAEAAGTPAAPAISAIADQTIDEDGSTEPIAFTVGDEDTPAEDLVVTASSSDITKVPNGNIVIGGSGANRTITVTPALDKNGTVTITVKASDGQKITYESFNLVINPVNDPPVNTVPPSITGTAHVGKTLSSSFGTWNDSKDMRPGTIGYIFQWQRADDPDGTNLAVVSEAGRNYQVTAADNGKYIRVRVTAVNTGEGLPNQVFVSNDTAWLLIDNAPPEINEGDIIDVTMDEDNSPQAFALTLNANDPDGDAVSWEISRAAGHGTASVSGTGLSKVIGYTAELNYHGSDSFEVLVSDGLGGTDTITVNVYISPVKDSLNNTAVPSITGTAHVGFSLSSSTGTWTDSDGNILSGLSYTYQWQRADEASGVNAADIPGATAGAYFLTTADNYKYVRVNVTAVDAGEGPPEAAGSSAASAWVLVANAPPVIAAGDSIAVTMDEDSRPAGFSLTLEAADPDGDALSWEITQGAGHGAASVEEAGGAVAAGYEPAANYHGSDGFIVRVSDGLGGTDNITVNVTVREVNDAPTLSEIEDLLINEDAGEQIINLGGITGGAANENQPLTITAVSDNQLLIPNPVVDYISPGSAGSLKILPAANASGTATITVTVDDGEAAVSSTFKVTVNPVNDAPNNTVPPSITGTAHVGNSLSAVEGIWDDSTDQSPGDIAYTYQWERADDGNGANLVEIAGAINRTYTLTGEDNGKFVRAKVTATDNGEGQLSSASTTAASMWVLVANAAPEITEGEALEVTMDEDSFPQGFSLNLNAVDADGDAIAWEILDPAAHGVAEVSGAGNSKTISYTPDENYNGTDSFTVRVSDGLGGEDRITVSVNITEVNDAPSFTKGQDIISNKSARAQTIEAWAADLKAGPENEAGQQLEFIVSTDNEALFEAAPTLSSEGNLAFIAKDGVEGVATVEVRLRDNGSAANGGINLSEAKSFQITIDTIEPSATANYSTLEWTNQDVTAVLLPSEDITVINNNGLDTFTFTANGSFTFEFHDGVGNIGTATAEVTNIDKVPPVITLSGANPLALEVFSAYSEPGATAVDNSDGLIQSQLQIDSSAVDTKVIGEYAVRCNVIDEAGNAADEVVRTVRVVDTTPPVITLIGSSHISLEQGSQYVEPEAGAVDNYDSNINAKIIISSDLNMQVPGVYTVRYNVTDANGNKAAEVTRKVTVYRPSREKADKAIVITDYAAMEPLELKQISEDVILVEPKTSGDTVRVELTGQTYSKLLNRNGKIMLELRTAAFSYTVPLREINLGSIAAEFNTAPENLTVGISIENVRDDRAAKAAAVAEESGIGLGASIVEFKIEVFEAQGKVQRISDFAGYITRTLVMEQPLGSDAAVGVLFNPETNEYKPVPTLFATVDGKIAATLKHQGNGMYTIAAGRHTFADISGHWAKDDIELLASKLIISGKKGGAFEPNSEVTRAEFAAMLVRSLGITAIQPKSLFKDIGGEWYAEAVSAAANAGIVQGYPDGAFRPNAKISREEAVAMVIHAIEHVGFEPGIYANEHQLVKFADQGEIADWAKKYVAAASEADIVNGDEKGNFTPAQETTRAEAVVMLKRMLQHIGFMN